MIISWILVFLSPSAVVGVGVGLSVGHISVLASMRACLVAGVCFCSACEVVA